jgi:hypothetical protein
MSEFQCPRSAGRYVDLEPMEPRMHTDSHRFHFERTIRTTIIQNLRRLRRFSDGRHGHDGRHGRGSRVESRKSLLVAAPLLRVCPCPSVPVRVAGFRIGSKCWLILLERLESLFILLARSEPTCHIAVVSETAPWYSETRFSCRRVPRSKLNWSARALMPRTAVVRDPSSNDFARLSGQRKDSQPTSQEIMTITSTVVRRNESGICR